MVRVVDTLTTNAASCPLIFDDELSPASRDAAIFRQICYAISATSRFPHACQCRPLPRQLPASPRAYTQAEADEHAARDFSLVGAKHAISARCRRDAYHAYHVYFRVDAHLMLIDGRRAASAPAQATMRPMSFCRRTSARFPLYCLRGPLEPARGEWMQGRLRSEPQSGHHQLARPPRLIRAALPCHR